MKKITEKKVVVNQLEEKFQFNCGREQKKKNVNDKNRILLVE